MSKWTPLTHNRSTSQCSSIGHGLNTVTWPPPTSFISILYRLDERGRWQPQDRIPWVFSRLTLHSGINMMEMYIKSTRIPLPSGVTWNHTQKPQTHIPGYLLSSPHEKVKPSEPKWSATCSRSSCKRVYIHTFIIQIYRCESVCTYFRYHAHACVHT